MQAPHKIPRISFLKTKKNRHFFGFSRENLDGKTFLCYTLGKLKFIIKE